MQYKAWPGWLKKDQWLIIGIILLIWTLTRWWDYQAILGFGYDEDLAGWIIKDIFVDHHIRLIGQETSINGLYIGPLFYYLQGVFFELTGMDPIGGFYLTMVISLATLVSLIWAVGRYFGRMAGLAAGLLYTQSSGLAAYDQWVVPTQPTLLWSTWYLYAILGLYEGKRWSLVLLGGLVGLIWYIHIAFVPLLVLIPLVIWLGKSDRKIWTSREMLFGGIICGLLIVPVLIFELRHNFIQLHGLIAAITVNGQDVTGWQRMLKVVSGAGQAIIQTLIEPKMIAANSLAVISGVSLGVFVLSWWWLKAKNNYRWYIMIIWVVVVTVGQYLSKRPISEYYFTNLVVPVLVVESVLVSTLIGRWRDVIILILAGVILSNAAYILNRPDNPNGYLARMKIVEQITEDARNNNYPCVAINYITLPGRNAGYRYLMWWQGINSITPGNDVAVYSIVDPAGLSAKEIWYVFGGLGVIRPTNPKIDQSVCKKPDRQLLPLWGFTN